MRTLTPLLLIILAITQPLALLAQKDKSYILANTNVEALRRFATADSIRYVKAHAEALRIAREKGWPTNGLQYIDENGTPIYYKTDNSTAALMTRTTQLRNNLGVQGANMVIGEWDGGHARTSHQDLSGRVVLGDVNANNPYDMGSHATHVAGTLIGDPPGAGGQSEGMAPSATLWSYSSDNDNAEIAAAGASGLLVSNHSYGTICGWDYETEQSCFFTVSKYWTWRGGADQFHAGGDDPGFGRYNGSARTTDSIASLAPMLLLVKSAGNDDDSNPTNDVLCDDRVRNGPSGAYVNYDPALHPAGDQFQRSNISTWGNAKNILTVGNLQADQTKNPSSSWGITDDGRIKPDIYGKGTDIYSAESGSNSDYSVKTGTSMASPNVAGSLLLLQEAFELRNGNDGHYMRSATLKGLAIHQATDLGNAGPDVKYGWGLLNAEACGAHINEAVGYGGVQTCRILENPGTTGHVYTFNSNGNFRVTLCYTDAPGTATSVHNDPTAKLVNDLDLRVHGPGGVQFPYIINMNDPYATATTGDNDRDNVEQISRQGFPAGTYEVHVNVESGSAQPYSLIISGQNHACNWEVHHGPNSLAGGTYYAESSILSAGDVVTGSPVTYRAASVTLKPGFSAAAGTSFIAQPQPCTF